MWGCAYLEADRPENLSLRLVDFFLHGTRLLLKLADFSLYLANLSLPLECSLDARLLAAVLCLITRSTSMLHLALLDLGQQLRLVLLQARQL
jgi:hypothetical protein